MEKFKIQNKTKNILLTGTAGFIGSNFVPYFLDTYPEYNLINLDLLTYAGTLENLKECENKSKIKNTFNIIIPYWKDGLDDCLRRLGERR